MKEIIAKVSEDNKLTLDEVRAIFIKTFENAVSEVHAKTNDTTETKKIIREVFREFSGDHEEILTAEEAAKILKLPTTAIMTGFRNKEIPGEKIRGNVRFRKSDILGLLQPKQVIKPEKVTKRMSRLDMYRSGRTGTKGR